MPKKRHKNLFYFALTGKQNGQVRNTSRLANESKSQKEINYLNKICKKPLSSYKTIIYKLICKILMPCKKEMVVCRRSYHGCK